MNDCPICGRQLEGDSFGWYCDQSKHSIHYALDLNDDSIINVIHYERIILNGLRATRWSRGTDIYDDFNNVLLFHTDEILPMQRLLSKMKKIEILF